MKRISRLLVLSALGALLLGISPAHAGFSRWGDLAAEVSGGSFQVGFQKRLSQGGLAQWKCAACAHYVEAWAELDEVDDGQIDRDVTGFGLGYRYYVLTGDRDPRKKEGLAWSLHMGLSRADLDTPDQTRAAYYGGMALEYPITQSEYPSGSSKAGELRPFWMGLQVRATHNEIELDGRSLDYLSGKIGVRFVFPSKRDKQRAACLRERREAAESSLSAEELDELMAIDRPMDYVNRLDEILGRLPEPLQTSPCSEQKDYEPVTNIE